MSQEKYLLDEERVLEEFERQPGWLTRLLPWRHTSSWTWLATTHRILKYQHSGGGLSLIDLSYEEVAGSGLHAQGRKSHYLLGVAGILLVYYWLGTTGAFGATIDGLIEIALFFGLLYLIYAWWYSGQTEYILYGNGIIPDQQDVWTIDMTQTRVEAESLRKFSLAVRQQIEARNNAPTQTKPYEDHPESGVENE